ncbi:MAG: glycosyltransferase [Sulfurimonas sp. RIFCSPHIGHO2_12_FULL_36_9]|uniref:glycosyltransferase family 2 protein n=1 Tax=Sulfurimonas sp. RIFCSPLOWO2_12_36_12 TaxID=1802253 RepID=UPI0008AE19B5|nr:glycosyltransferase [Sulfurimonas sp. RIFCSPLOWO2_12_36_12]OHD96867.1 MAG: glycosyltransferase [Sulfurimonas sp. RIFCSPHIGHO2_12_FULL_36_9]OHD97465.1 MAG: glycosyltransferase [Sulfurimonas sp. RIFCSPLOWO2_02_FULL_36_28]OHE01595.1 MAG: glycosyltransferase [Sulfurimonas sp. RIFCSPLOWO2_12_36_12]OHE07616.1 MAG: glycosyltransferase [Sulfurimonas sp. RIFCSPLOWO2_12_FULL_36_74]
MEISVISPVYGCRESIGELYEKVTATLQKICSSYEIIFVNDNCPQNSWEVISAIAKNDKNVKAIKLSRNFGQHYAITAGIDHCSGKYAIVMDCDLQDKPEEMEKLYKKALEGYDVVHGRRVERQDSFFKSFTSKLFYKTLEYFTDTEHDYTIGNFGIYSRKVIDAVKELKEKSRDFLLLVKIVGFKKTEIAVEHSERVYGKSSYNFSKMLDLAIDSIVSHSNKPLRLIVQFGLMVSMLSFFVAVGLVVAHFTYGFSVEGWTSLMVSMFFLFGILFGILGIIGLYIGKIFDQVKNRPLYIIDEMIN